MSSASKRTPSKSHPRRSAVPEVYPGSGNKRRSRQSLRTPMQHVPLKMDDREKQRRASKSFVIADQDDTPRAHIEAFMSGADTAQRVQPPFRRARTPQPVTPKDNEGGVFKTPRVRELAALDSDDRRRHSSPGMNFTPRTNIWNLLQEGEEQTPVERTVDLTERTSPGRSDPTSARLSGQRVSVSPIHVSSVGADSRESQVYNRAAAGKVTHRSFHLSAAQQDAGEVTPEPSHLQPLGPGQRVSVSPIRVSDYGVAGDDPPSPSVYSRGVSKAARRSFHLDVPQTKDAYSEDDEEEAGAEDLPRRRAEERTAAGGLEVENTSLVVGGATEVLTQGMSLGSPTKDVSLTSQYYLSSTRKHSVSRHMVAVGSDLSVSAIQPVDLDRIDGGMGGTEEEGERRELCSTRRQSVSKHVAATGRDLSVSAIRPADVDDVDGESDEKESGRRELSSTRRQSVSKHVVAVGRDLSVSAIQSADVDEDDGDRDGKEGGKRELSSTRRQSVSKHTVAIGRDMSLSAIRPADVDEIDGGREGAEQESESEGTPSRRTGGEGKAGGEDVPAGDQNSIIEEELIANRAVEESDKSKVYGDQHKQSFKTNEDGGMPPEEGGNSEVEMAASSRGLRRGSLGEVVATLLMKQNKIGEMEREEALSHEQNLSGEIEREEGVSHEQNLSGEIEREERVSPEQNDLGGTQREERVGSQYDGKASEAATVEPAKKHSPSVYDLSNDSNISETSEEPKGKQSTRGSSSKRKGTPRKGSSSKRRSAQTPTSQSPSSLKRKRLSFSEWKRSAQQGGSPDVLVSPRQFRALRNSPRSSTPVDRSRRFFGSDKIQRSVTEFFQGDGDLASTSAAMTPRTNGLFADLSPIRTPGTSRKAKVSEEREEDTSSDLAHQQRSNRRSTDVFTNMQTSEKTKRTNVEDQDKTHSSEDEFPSFFSMATPHIDLRRRAPVSSVQRGQPSAQRSNSKMANQIVPKRTQQQRAPSKRSTKTISTVLPRRSVKYFSELHSDMKLSKDAIEEIEKVSERFWADTFSALEAYALHAGRKTVQDQDVILLMKTQRLITGTEDLHNKIRQMLPMELRTKLIPCAYPVTKK